MIAMGALAGAWNVGHIRGDNPDRTDDTLAPGQKNLFFDLASATADVDLALGKFQPQSSLKTPVRAEPSKESNQHINHYTIVSWMPISWMARACSGERLLSVIT